MFLDLLLVMLVALISVDSEMNWDINLSSLMSPRDLLDAIVIFLLGSKWRFHQILNLGSSNTTVETRL